MTVTLFAAAVAIVSPDSPKPYIPGSATTNRIFIAGYELVPKREVKDGR